MRLFKVTWGRRVVCLWCLTWRGDALCTKIVEAPADIPNDLCPFNATVQNYLGAPYGVPVTLDPLPRLLKITWGRLIVRLWCLVRRGEALCTKSVETLADIPNDL